MRKRITALLLSVVLCLGMLSTAALAATTPTAEGKVGEKTITVTAEANKLCALWGDEDFTKLLLLFYTGDDGKATIEVEAALTTNSTYYVGVAGQTGEAVKVDIKSDGGNTDPPVTPPSGGDSGTPSTPTYAISVPSSTANGTVSVSPTRASAGSKVTITAKPDSGYEVGTVTVTDKNGNKITVTDAGNNKYTFTMPNSKVDVKVEFVKVVEPVRFVDVADTDWFADAVKWAVENGITEGTTKTTFSPNAPCTRAQVVTFLWRAAGSPRATGTNPFKDIAANDYYYDAVLWAVENGITKGTTATTFSPNQTCTRAQIVTFLYRYEGSPAVFGGNSFSDVAANDYYANAVNWAISKEVTVGMSATRFSPNSTCTRAQAVTFLYRDLA